MSQTRCGILYVASEFTSRHKQRTEQRWCSETAVNRDKQTAKSYVDTGGEIVNVPEQDNHYKMFIVAMSLCCAIYYRQGFNLDIFFSSIVQDVQISTANRY
jgi:hypothetical protein